MIRCLTRRCSASMVLSLCRFTSLCFFAETCREGSVKTTVLWTPVRRTSRRTFVKATTGKPKFLSHLNPRLQLWRLFRGWG
ncbi:hypothetical protein BJX61DRAFT_493865 [Aspergillus egyptiacus]|nr:hypothetical protein BJX61DRAFT_493865 [Aspergillus egyptiacus]